MTDPKTIILSLVTMAIEGLMTSRDVAGVHENEAATKRATGYLEAANALLARHPELHRELIEHPDFMAARKLARQGGFY